MDRSERRRIKKELRKNTHNLRKHGLPRDTGIGHVSVLALEMSDILKKQGSKRASNALKFAQEVFDHSISKGEGFFEIDCRGECSYCCHLFTGASAPEIFAIADEVRSTRSESQIIDILDRCKPLVGKRVTDRTGQKLPCPLLENNLCSVYEARPLSCRRYTSASASDCEAVFEGVRDEIHYSTLHLNIGEATKIALQASLQACNLPRTGYELGEALSIALQNPDSEERWLAGEDVFSECQIDEGQSKELSAKIDYVATIVR